MHALKKKKIRNLRFDGNTDTAMENVQDQNQEMNS